MPTQLTDHFSRPSSHLTPGQSSPTDFSILYFNARSILPKLDDLRVEVAAQNLPLCCVCIVETWLSEDISDLEISIENYDVVRLDRNRHGGGVLIYTHTSLTWEVLIVEGSEQLGVFKFVH